MNADKIYEQTKEVVRNFLQPYEEALTKDTVLVVGCSTSEVCGGVIGKNSDVEIGAAIARAVLDVVAEYGINLAAQCCEHLNRALIMEQAVAKAKGWAEVWVMPQPKAGGSFATGVYQNMQQPVAVEAVQADYGLDIGCTLIGMHLKPVAVPVRLQVREIGATTVVGARTRPKLIGGERAVYPK